MRERPDRYRGEDGGPRLYPLNRYPISTRFLTTNFMAILLAFMVGLALGSLLNVVITRLPRGERVWAGRSPCPHCGTMLPWYDYLPLLRSCWMHGRRRCCRDALSPLAPLVAWAGGLLGLFLWHRFPASPLLLAYGPFAAALLTLSAIDLEHRFLPDAITLPGIVLGLALAALLPHLTFRAAAAGALLGGFLFFVVGWVYEKLTGNRGLGGGDVKMMAMIGAFLGVQALPFVIFISAALGSLASLAAAWRTARRAGEPWRAASIPFGPFLALAACLYLLGGRELLRLG